MTVEPYASAKRVFWVVDNGSSHRGQKAIDRLARRFPNAVMVHTPVHASWVNQVEIYFSVVQRKVVSPNDFTDLNEVEQRLTDFEGRYNATAQPFQWRFTALTFATCSRGSTDTNNRNNRNNTRGWRPPFASNRPPNQPPRDLRNQPLRLPYSLESLSSDLAPSPTVVEDSKALVFNTETVVSNEVKQ